MNDPFYNLYHIIYNTGLSINNKLQKYIFKNLGDSDPKSLYMEFDDSDVYNRLTYKKIIFHDQEPILFHSFEEDK
jgi:hypothetical protein